MRIKSIELNGYKRFALTEIKHFKLKPTQRVQMFLGRNGSGKSSLMAEMTPLPAVAANYTKDGSKTIEILYHGKEYLLKNDFASGHVHSFLKEGEELNPGGTLTVQRELVKQEFGVRQEIHDLITGVEKFTGMSPSRRREWFTELCDTSYDYALAVYGRTKDATRDINGALKLAKKRLVAETAMIVKDADQVKLNEQITQLVAEIDLLYRSRVEQMSSMNELEDEQARLERECLNLSKRLLSLQDPHTRFLHPDEIKADIDALKEQAIAISTEIALLVKEHAALKETHDACIQTGHAGLQNLQEQFKTLQETRNQVLSERRLGLEFNTPQGSLTALENIWSNLQNIFSKIPLNENRLFSQANLSLAKDKRLSLKDRIVKIDDHLEKLRHQKHHLDELIRGEKTQCPKCNHQWVPGYSPSVYAKMLEVIEDLVKKREDTVKDMGINDETIDANLEYGELMKEYITLSRMSKDYLQPFWDLINGEELIYKAPRSIEARMEQLKHDLNKAIHASQIDAEIEKTKDLIQVAAKASDVDVAKVATRLDAVEETLGTLSQTLKQVNARQQTNQVALNKVQEFLNLEVKIKNYQSLLEKGVTNLVKSLRNELITSALRTLQIELAQKQKTLNDIQKQQAVVDNIAEQVKSLTRDEDVHKLLLSALSPSDGLIAEGLLGFIKTFVRKMNIIIRKIWSYKLEVQDCSTEGEDGAELDYKFAVIVGNERIADVKMGSTGIREVIDLAFKIVSCHYLDLSEASLFLDEFGSSFDHEHRIAATAAIKAILEQLPFSQLFMISHYEDHYGAFTNAEFCVLNKDQTVVPSNYNQHVEIA